MSDGPKPKKKIKPGIYRAWREKPSPGWYYIYDIRLDGRRVRTPRGLYFPTIKECSDAVDTLRADHRRKVYKFPADDARVTIADVRDLWLEALRSRQRSKTYTRANEYSFEQLAKVTPLIRPVKDLTTENLAELVRRREREKVARPTIRNNLALIRYALLYAAENMPELADWRPPKQPEGMSRDPGRHRNRLVSREEEAVILAELRSNPTHRSDGARTRGIIADVFELALQTGMRLRELVNLKKTDAHLGRAPGYEWGWLTVRGIKGGADRTMPLNEESAAILARARSRSDLIFELAGGIESRTSLADRMLQEACNARGIPYGRDIAGGLVFHDCRHTVITRLLQNGEDLATVMALAGHKNPATTLRVYSHATTKSLARAIAGLVKRDPGRDPSASTGETNRGTQGTPGKETPAVKSKR
jgi:integrase